MKLSLKSATRRLIERRLKSGRYSSADELVHAGLLALQQQEEFGDYAPGELNVLLEAGERSIDEEGTVDGDAVFAELRRRSQRRRRARKAG